MPSSKLHFSGLSQYMQITGFIRFFAKLLAATDGVLDTARPMGASAAQVRVPSSNKRLSSTSSAATGLESIRWQVYRPPC